MTPQHGTLWTEKFSPQIAEAIKAANNAMAGLPKFLGCTITEISAGRLKAELPVRKDLLTPIGNLHGGVLAGFVDHILGVVLYPLMT
ncbi:MAG: PaaI family thioesterase, partial [Bdellovibrionota bacterium]